MLLKKLITNHESTKMHQTNNMSYFTIQIIITANKINGVKKNISSMQYFALCK
jgi:hypothetical protein